MEEIQGVQVLDVGRVDPGPVNTIVDMVTELDQGHLHMDIPIIKIELVIPQ